MKSVYLDNAATTPMLPEVIEVIQQSMQTNFGNPSSIHQHGRKAKAAVETARKSIAKHFNVSSSEIIFTAGGTEADNLILFNAVLNLGVERIITSKIEHHAVLNTVQFLEEKHNLVVDYVKVNEEGAVSMESLGDLLNKSKKKTLVSLMYVNNEIGNLLSIEEVVALCKEHEAYFHSDTVQAIGHYDIDLQKTQIDFITASAHKFHGPKGVGFAYFKKGIGILPMLHGGEQEKGARSSTENVHSIVGMEKALTIAFENLQKDKKYIFGLKEYFTKKIKEVIPNIRVNGESIEKTSYTIVNIQFPLEDKMLLFNLDLSGIAVSGGSACQSGSSKGSHVLREFLSEKEEKKTSIRFSFSKLNTIKEIDYTINQLKRLLK
ncbi:cysteine desulfurase family protein [Tenacibaculum mesophilum]|uniref:cysteine desulfurase n=1 Tax=Tenacibaculum mesophilum TaxID=104268 RepID=A0ABM7CE54_9FLAO|nr:cysteine desulfurase family protein [Tenacibaculum mesophilum]GFD92710.1 cysteine desulfurase [Alteromonas sp. KUL154]GFE01444.1 cysteine desulfurase [Alteromonas sp. KUL156]AZJ32018.1 cysteine desulfurase [Tenacibaculum mesophilum]QFS27277.1 aminotransferase class V-fold PLP-dependent enzyme [Tenacibaculum mesophilum]SHF88528.1 cysteine desulfurase [Tenacibaculum mesophilum]